jgi:signal transduction histidine kinase/ActR/RegA family two-component response regulator
MRDWLQRLLRSWFDLPLVKKGAIVISIPLACILLSVAAMSILQRQRSQLTDWIGRAFHAGSSIQAVITLLSEAESGARAFLVTRDIDYLHALSKAETSLGQGLARIRKYVGDIPSQQDRLGRVEALATQRLVGLRAAVSGSGLPTVTERLAEGRVLKARVEQEFAAMREEESRLWIARIAAEGRMRGRVSALLYGSAGLSLCAGSLAMVLFLTGISRRAETLRKNADRLAHGEPLTPMSGGVDELGKVSAALAKASVLLAERDRDLRRLNDDLEARVRERTAALEREMAARRSSEEQLRESQKMDAIGRLAGGIAHDFNNVLTVVIGFGESLADRVSSVEAREDLDEVLRAARHATTLTRQLLAFSRRQVIQPQLISVNEVIRRTEKFLRRVVGEDIELKTICPEMREKVLADEGQLEQVIVNLALNARDAMPNGGQLVIQTDLVELDETFCGSHLNTAPGRHIMIAVRDSGHGMSPEVRDRIFEPFFTTKPPTKGTGLGLATVYGIVKQNAGSIWVYSEPGMGAIFKIYFPVAEVREERAAVAAASAPGEARSVTILLVEDEASVRRMAKQALTRCGHLVLEADGAEAAIELCQKHGSEIDLLLTDVVMPKTNGRELARSLEATYPKLKVLYMSGYSGDVMAMQSVVESGVQFIEKPFTPASLARKISEVFPSRAAE